MGTHTMDMARCKLVAAASRNFLCEFKRLHNGAYFFAILLKLKMSFYDKLTILSLQDLRVVEFGLVRLAWWDCACAAAASHLPRR